ncbi:Glycosyl hydrolase family 3 N terminal domain protein [Brevundimonas sp. BAL3]|nr:Glycosyl hydrolase family 3 N terminal domain protein [Brevundimonas sp. BAL3]
MTDAATEAFVADLLGRMTVEEKVGQMIQADIASIKPEDLLIYPLGSILAGGNSSPGGDERASAGKWVDLAQAFRAANAQRKGTVVPLIYGIDAVHGHNNVVGATIFPHNIGLGAARDPDLIRRIGQATALEVAVTGADWTFGPTLAVPRDDRWGRAYEGYAENPEIQRAYAAPMTLGLQGDLSADSPLAAGHIAGSAKHFLADGGTFEGKDQGDFQGHEREMIDVHLGGYPQAIDAGVLSIMASFSSWNGVKHSGNETILTDVLRGPLGFDGFVVSDWNAHGQLPGCSNESCALAVNAGIDMLMAPDSWKPLYQNTLAQVRSGEIPTARLDEAVRRILRVKVKTGLFSDERPVEGRLNELGSPAHRAIAREAVRKSLVLLKNEGAVLPIRSGARVLVAGHADDIGQASGGWTLTWQGTGNTNADFPNGQSIWGGIQEAVAAGGGQATLSPDGAFTQKPDVAIIVFGETPYAEFQGDVDTLDFLPTEPLETLKRLDVLAGCGVLSEDTGPAFGDLSAGFVQHTPVKRLARRIRHGRRLGAVGFEARLIQSNDVEVLSRRSRGGQAGKRGGRRQQTRFGCHGFLRGERLDPLRIRAASLSLDSAVTTGVLSRPSGRAIVPDLKMRRVCA